MLYIPARMLVRFHVGALIAGFIAAGFILAGWKSLIVLPLWLYAGLAVLMAHRANERRVRQRVHTELALSDSASTLGILFDDYQEQAADWQWKLGPDGTIEDPSDRFATSAGVTAAELEGRPLVELVLPGPERERLAGHVAEGTPFRDLVVPVGNGQGRRYWRLSGRPRGDGRISGVARDVTRDRQIEERVAFMAHYDNLTGLANRYLFNERLAALTGDPRRRSSVALFYLDLDDFKMVNDARGHLIGDRLLREVGTRLEQEVRGEDLVVRLGGDEFAVLIETRAGAGMLIERAHRFLSVVREPYEIDGQILRVSTSIGIARCSEGDCDAQELLRRADLALFAAKGKGRNTMALFEPALDRAARERRELEDDLREAIARGQLKLHYQPIIDLDNARTVGYEALLRWYHPRRGVLSPSEFLQIIEDTGLVVPIGEWVIRQALTETVSWPGEARIAINLSPTQVRSPQLVGVVAQALTESGYAPGRVEFEITEHVLMREGDAGYATLLKLRDMGTRIALDDFGTGYSSLSYLRRFPFDRIKIDRNFVEDIENSRQNQAIVTSITQLAEALGMETTAEGVERPPQLEMLRRLGCKEAQGFLICKPLAAEDLPATDRPPQGPSSLGSGVVDYRQAREAVLRRRGSDAA